MLESKLNEKDRKAILQTLDIVKDIDRKVSYIIEQDRERFYKRYSDYNDYH